MKRSGDLLAKYEALGASLEIIHQYLETARQALAEFACLRRPRPVCSALTDYLARQTDGLGLRLRAVYDYD